MTVPQLYGFLAKEPTIDKMTEAQTNRRLNRIRKKRGLELLPEIKEPAAPVFKPPGELISKPMQPGELCPETALG